ncbi:phosphoenolpyruvate--protein phosphotransferase, partial [Lachnotalea glycerini]
MIKVSVSKTTAKGYATGQAYIVRQQEVTIDQNKITQQEVQREIYRYEDAVLKAKEELKELAKKSPIFEAHMILVEDMMLYDGVVNKIKDEFNNAEAALQRTGNEFVEMFENIDDEYMRERATDMKDVTFRIMRHLKGIPENAFLNMTKPCIVVANDLTPSEVSQMNMKFVVGLITQEGGITSHVSIIAKNMGIPCFVGVDGILEKVKSDDIIIMDALESEILIHPDEATINLYEKSAIAYSQRQQEIKRMGNLPSVTVDQRKFCLCGNVGSLEDIKQAILQPIDGIGLFRSEFLYMEKDHFPTEQEQFDAYQNAALLLEKKELIIRTLDIGGDKKLKYYEFMNEENPFLGYRAIRICLDQPEIFKTQLRAILRASAYGNIKIMFPMIISLEELYEAKRILEACKGELTKEEIDFDKDIKVGMMIETPASVFLAEDFAKEVDFFSIGTNDLTQYILAVDRGNQKIATLYNTYHPAVLRAIYHTILSGHKQGILVG